MTDLVSYSAHATSTADLLLNTTLYLTGEITDSKQHDLNKIILVTVSVFTLLTFTVGGNILVLVAIIRDPKLHTLSRKLIASLAVTDLLVGLLVLPLAAISEFTDLGHALCDFFVTTDVLLCTNSILHLVVIAIDRYWTATDVTYRKGATKYDLLFPVGVFLTWLAALVVSLPPVLGWRPVHGVTNDCTISQSKSYTIFSTVSAFYFPLLVIIFIYTKVFRAVKATANKKHFTRTNADKKSPSNNNTEENERNCLLGKNSPSVTRDTMQEDKKLSQIHYSPAQENGDLSATKKKTTAISVKFLRKTKSSHMCKKKKVAQKRERRALRTLIIITGTFVSCWMPFFIMAILLPFCGESCNTQAARTFHVIVTWLGYVNSMLNPIIYTIFMPELRSAFHKIFGLCCRCCQSVGKASVNERMPKPSNC